MGWLNLPHSPTLPLPTTECQIWILAVCFQCCCFWLQSDVVISCVCSQCCCLWLQSCVDVSCMCLQCCYLSLQSDTWKSLYKLVRCLAASHHSYQSSGNTRRTLQYTEGWLSRLLVKSDFDFQLKFCLCVMMPSNYSERILYNSKIWSGKQELSVNIFFLTCLFHKIWLISSVGSDWHVFYFCLFRLYFIIYCYHVLLTGYENVRAYQNVKLWLNMILSSYILLCMYCKS